MKVDIGKRMRDSISALRELAKTELDRKYDEKCTLLREKKNKEEKKQ